MQFSKQVYSFEPGPANFRRLEATLSRNRHHFGSTQAFQIGLSNANGTLPFMDVFSSAASVGKQGRVMIQVTTLDAFLSGRDVQIGFIKCDTEGYGLQILEGAEQTLKKHRPVISFAVYHNSDEFFKIPTLLTKWFPDYDFQWFFGVYSPLRWNELSFLGTPREIDNAMHS
jgi:FkbM family methyltransferase